MFACILLLYVFIYLLYICVAAFPLVAACDFSVVTYRWLVFLLARLLSMLAWRGTCDRNSIFEWSKSSTLGRCIGHIVHVHCWCLSAPRFLCFIIIPSTALYLIFFNCVSISSRPYFSVSLVVISKLFSRVLIFLQSCFNYSQSCFKYFSASFSFVFSRVLIFLQLCFDNFSAAFKIIFKCLSIIL